MHGWKIHQKKTREKLSAIAKYAIQNKKKEKLTKNNEPNHYRNKQRHNRST